MNTSEKIGVTGITLSIIAIGYSIYQSVKINHMAKLVGTKVTNISNSIEVDVPESIVSEAVDLAVEREVTRSVRSISFDIRNSMASDIKKKVSTTVSDAYNSIKDSVSSETRRQVAKIDISDLRTEIKDEAKEKVLSKFDDDLKTILDDYNQNLSNVSKIYNSIAENMAKK